MSAADFLSETALCEKEMRDQGHAIAEIGNAMPKPPQSNSAPPPAAEARQGPGSRPVMGGADSRLVLNRAT